MQFLLKVKTMKRLNDFLGNVGFSEQLLKVIENMNIVDCCDNLDNVENVFFESKDFFIFSSIRPQFNEDMLEQQINIEALSDDKICFVKKINLENKHYSSVICYVRKLSETYKMHPSEQKSSISVGYQEDEYPSDILDEVIMSAIQKKYPQAVCCTSLQIFNKDLEDNVYWAEQRLLTKCKFYFVEIIEEKSTNYVIPIERPNRAQEIIISYYSLARNNNDKDLLFEVEVTTSEYDKLQKLLGTISLYIDK